MASTRIFAPVRGVSYQLSRLSLRHNLRPTRCNECLSRSITTSTSSQASITPITTSAADHVPIKPFEEQTVLATIHQFPSLEPLRFETYPANHLYLPTRKDILHRAVIYEGDNTRQGTASTKSRHEVRGSAHKLRPQKGSGRARLGDRKSPMLKGGGVAFGPSPERKFETALPKKVYDLAWRTALSYRYRKGELIIVDNAMEIESPSIRLLSDIFKHHEKLQGRGRSLLVTLDERPLLKKALIRMDRGEQTLTWEEVDVKDLLELSRIIIERSALRKILLSHHSDLTHMALHPRHTLIDHKKIIGWAEFRNLQLLAPKDQEADRPAAYENVASKRYEHACTLPKSPQRTDLTISVYNLIAEARALQFQEKTGMAWSEYAEPSIERNQDPEERLQRITGHKENIAISFSRVKLLEFQINEAEAKAQKASQISSTKGNQLDLDAATLELEKLKLQHHAALLAAQVHEHYAEAKRLARDKEAAELEIRLAGSERSTVDVYDYEILQQQVKVAELKLGLLMAKKSHGRQVDAAKKVLEEWRVKLAEREEALEALEALEEEMEEGEGEALVVEAPVVEEVVRKEEKR